MKTLTAYHSSQVSRIAELAITQSESIESANQAKITESLVFGGSIVMFMAIVKVALAIL